MGVSTYSTTPPPDLGLIPLILSILWCLALHSLCNLYVCTCCWNLDFSDCIHSLITFMHLARLFIQSNLQKRNKTTIMYIMYLLYFIFLPQKHTHTLFYIYYTMHKEKDYARDYARKCALFGLSVQGQSAWVRVTYCRCCNGVITAICHVVEIWRDLVKRWRRGGRCIERYGWVEREKLFSCTIK